MELYHADRQTAVCLGATLLGRGSNKQESLDVAGSGEQINIIRLDITLLITQQIAIKFPCFDSFHQLFKLYVQQFPYGHGNVT